jgi:uncharacterized protein (TIGR02145 family)
MKKLVAILVPMATGILLTATLWAQSPEKLSYQAVIRDGSDNLVTNTSVGMQISILQGDVFGASVYVETQSATTNANGLLSVEIGSENASVLKGNFVSIDWANGPYFIKTETDPTGGQSYTITGTSQLLSVPYALHAKTAETVTGGITEADPAFTAWDKSTGIAITESQINDLGNYIETESDPTVPAGTAEGEMQYWNGTAWVTVASGNEGQFLTFNNGEPVWISLAGVTPVGATDVYSPTTDKVWMDKNLGASQVATSSTDAAAYGDLYQWGRGTDGHESRTSGTTSTLATSYSPGHGDFITTNISPFDWRNPQNDNLWQGVSGTNNPCPSGYRLPTEAEWDAERTSWSSNNAAGAFASPLKLTMAGHRNFRDGSLRTVGSSGYYWSSTVEASSSRNLLFSGSLTFMMSSLRAYGFSVRCLKD